MRVLFLCTQNACRSQMAELWAEHLFPGGEIEAASAGTRPAVPNPRMLQVMAEAGVDTSSARSKPVEELADQPWDLAITLCDSAAEECPVLPGAGRTLHRPFPDPAMATGSEDQVLAEFRRVRDLVRAFVESLLSSPV